MKLHELTAPYRRKKTRVGRGLSAGKGKTAGRGTKGQRARTGFNVPRRFEGGQSSFIQRLPKRKGFRSVIVKPVSVRIDRVLAQLGNAKVTIGALERAGLLSAAEARIGRVKLVGTVPAPMKLKLGKGVVATKALTEKLTLVP